MAEETADAGPGRAFSGFEGMENLLDNLKLLNYDDFVKSSPSFKPLSRHYFVNATNAGEQFYMFVSISAFLVREAGGSMEQPQEHDDPNAVISGILDALRGFGLSVNFSPASLKSGAGDNCIYVMKSLAQKAVENKAAGRLLMLAFRDISQYFEQCLNLKRAKMAASNATPRCVICGVAYAVQRTRFRPTIPADEPEEEEPPQLEENEVTAEQYDEEEPESADDDDEAGFLSLDNVRPVASAEKVKPKLEILQSDTDSVQWLQEVERVLPSLKITLRQDAKDWRSHIEQLATYRNQIKQASSEAGGQLQKLANEIGRSLDQIGSREKYLNQQLEGMLSQFRTVQDRCAEIKQQYKEASTGVTERSRRLGQITEELEQVKQTMEDRGSNLTDGAPLVKIKQAITRLYQEMEGMDVQIGVIEQSLLQAQLRNRTNLQEDMHSIPQLDFGGY